MAEGIQAPTGQNSARTYCHRRHTTGHGAWQVAAWETRGADHRGCSARAAGAALWYVEYINYFILLQSSYLLHEFYYSEK